MEKTVNLGYVPREWQRRLHREKKRFSIAICHRRAGKSYAAAMELLHCALSEPKTYYAYMAPFLSQAKKVMWPLLKEMAIKIPFAEIRESDLLITFPNGSTIRCMGADNADSARGLGHHGLVVDEFQLFDPTVLPLVLLPTLAGTNGWLLEIGTPSGVDALTEAYDRAKDDPEWACLKFTVKDTGVLSDLEIETQRKQMTQQQFDMEFMCSFDAGSPNQLFPGSLVDEAFARDYTHEQYKEFPRIMGVDIARQGNDKSVIFRRMGPKTWEPVAFQCANLMETARRIATEYQAFKADALFVDAGGIGAGAVDALREMGVPVVEAQFGGKPIDDRYLNSRAEMYHMLYLWLREGGQIPRMPILKAELTGLRYQQDDKGKLKLDSKEDMRKRGMHSPDHADGLALTFYAPVFKQFDRDADVPKAADTWELW